MSKKRKSISKYERTAENDIQYRGPITYRHMQIMGWICICFKVVDIVFSVGRNLDPKFVILALHIKFDESRFRKRDKSPEDFEEYTRTNDHSLRFSVFTSIMILITGLIDLLVYVLSSVFLTYTTVGADMSAPLTQEAENALDEVITTAMQVVGAWRFGEHFKMIPLISLILLFSYTKNHKNERVDLFIPIGGVALAFLVGIEGTYQGIVMNLPILMEKITELASQFLG